MNLQQFSSLAVFTRRRRTVVVTTFGANVRPEGFAPTVRRERFKTDTLHCMDVHSSTCRRSASCVRSTSNRISHPVLGTQPLQNIDNGLHFALLDLLVAERQDLQKRHRVLGLLVTSYVLEDGFCYTVLRNDERLALRIQLVQDVCGVCFQ